jgi:NADH dehydrogenase FAD-containing subunit
MPKLLVIGAGTAGCSAIVGLRSQNKDCEIVLVEPKDHLEAFWATYRSPFDAGVRNSSLMVLEQWTKKHKVRHIRSTLTKLDTKSALLANGEEVSFDVAVLCTGANIPSLGRDQNNDGTKESRMEFLKKFGEDCLSAKSVVVVGGGLVGIELVGDIAAYGKRSKKEIQLTVGDAPFMAHASDHY